MGKCNGKQLNGKTTTVKDLKKGKKSVSTKVHVKTRQYCLETQTLRISQKLFLSLTLVLQIYDQYMSELFFCFFSLELHIWYFSEVQSHSESFQFIHSQISFICELLIAMLF